MISVPIHTGKPYEVHIGSGLLSQCGTILSKTVTPCRAVLVTDSNVGPLYQKSCENALKASGFDVLSYTFPAGEDSKSLFHLERLLEFLAVSELTRSDLLIALGGGVTGDLTGFAASIYLRGIRYIQIPTTLLAAVDSSVGGKTAVNLEAGKNLAGSFWQPCTVICDTNLLKTLPREYMLDGISESIKYGIIRDEPLFQRIAIGGCDTDTEAVIAACVAMKGAIVAEDEFDNGTRELLNYGHTLGHAIESLSDFSVSHGHAVAIGMHLAGKISLSLGLCSAACSLQITNALRTLHLPVETPYTAKEMIPTILRDKKRRGSTIDLILPREIGCCIIHPVPVDQLLRLLKSCLD